jgi:hypothetical protein
VFRSTEAGLSVGRLGGEGITTAKFGFALRAALSRSLFAPLVAVLFSFSGDAIIGLAACDNDFKFKWGGVRPSHAADSRRGRTWGELGRTCFSTTISWSSSLIAIGSGEDAVERPAPRGGGALLLLFCGGRR